MLKGSLNLSQGKVVYYDSKPDVLASFPAIVFLHGHCTNKSFFKEQLSSKSFDSYRMIALDLPGYGESEAPKEPEKVYNFPGFAEVAAEFILSLGLTNFIVVGWSLGGHVALELTSKFQTIKGLLITGTPPIEVSLEGLGRGFKIANPQVAECFGKGNLTEEEAELLATISGYDYTNAKRFIVEAIHQTDEGAKTIYPSSILKGLGQNEVEIVREWPFPIAVIAGKEDSGINNDYIMHEVTFKNLWRKQVHLIPEAGHAVFLEQPTQFNQLLSEFLVDVFKSS